MRSISFKSTFALTALVVTSLLAACGGGGGGGGSSSGGGGTTTYTATCADGSTQTSTVSQATAQAQCPTTSTIVNTTLPATSTYAATGRTEELAAFNLLNQERQRCGFGTLTQNEVLDTAAKNHAAWQVINSTLSHYETSGTIGFTGVSINDRINAVGGYGTIGGSSDDFTTATTGVTAVRGLLNAPFHMAGLLGNYRDIGISYNDASGYASFPIFQFNFAHTSTSGPQIPSGSDVLTYPCEGTTGTNIQLTNETPNPVPGRNLIANPLGVSIFVLLRSGNTLAISSATMTQVSGVAAGTAVTMRTPVVNYFASVASGYIAANAPLLANTQYQVNLAGTNAGVAWSRSFTFTTGTGG